MTLLEIIQIVCEELGLVAPAQVVSSPDQQVRQIYRLANREGNELLLSHQWTALQQQHVVNVEVPVVTTGDVTAGSAVIANIASGTGGITAGLFAAIGEGIATAARVKSVDGPNDITMDMPATANGVGVSVTFAKDTYAIPDDFSWFLNRTMWDRLNRWELIGPISPQFDQWQRSGIVTTGPRRRWRQVGISPNNWRLWPPPTASSDAPAPLVFEYVSNAWVLGQAGVRKQSFTADDDTPLIDDKAIILGTKWRFWQIKGFDYAALQAEYLAYVSRLAARDGGAPDLNLSRGMATSYLLGNQNVQDGFWPGPGS